MAIPDDDKNPHWLSGGIEKIEVFRSPDEEYEDTVLFQLEKFATIWNGLLAGLGSFFSGVAAIVVLWQAAATLTIKGELQDIRKEVKQGNERLDRMGNQLAIHERLDNAHTANGILKKNEPKPKR